MNKNNKKILRDFIFILAIIITFLFLLEFSSRVVFNYDFSILKIIKESNNPTLLYELKPNAQIVFRGLHRPLPPTTVKTSSQGLRDHEYSLTKPEGVFRIIILGDSIGMGWGVELEDTAAKQLERLLNMDQKNKYQVINFSIVGYNFVQEMELLEKKCLRYNPDLVVIISCYNDYLPASKGIKFSRFLLKSYLMASLVVKRELMIEKNKVLYFQEGISKVRNAFSRLDGMIKGQNLKVLFYKTPDWLKNVIEEYGLEKNIMLVNSNLRRHVIDKIDGHPDPDGHSLMAQDIYRYLKNQHII
ncbi:MAG: SGNH/GDSL hydrolase family protein [Candidatus Omnitrophota bacterium]